MRSRQVTERLAPNTPRKSAALPSRPRWIRAARHSTAALRDQAVLLAAQYFTNINGMLLFWIAFILTRPLGAVLGNMLKKSDAHVGLDWGKAPTAVLVGALIVLVGYQAVAIRRHPLQPLPAPINRRTGEPQRPNGALVTLPQNYPLVDANSGLVISHG